jgi:hypothetical protein
MADKGHIAFVLDAHHSEQPAVTLQAPENNSIVNLGPELSTRHVGLMPPIGRYNPFVGLGSIVDGFNNRSEIRFAACSYHGHRTARGRNLVPESLN